MASESIDIVVRDEIGLTHFVSWISVALEHQKHDTLFACTPRGDNFETHPTFLMPVGTAVTCLLCMQQSVEWRLTTKGIGNVLREMLELSRG